VVLLSNSIIYSMPKPRRQFKRKPFPKKTFKKKRRVAKVRATSELVTYMAPRQMPFPPRYRTKFNIDIYGSIAAGSATGQYFASLNSCLTPLAGGAWPGPSLAIAGAECTGLTQLLNANFYKKFRVYGSKISIEFLPQALADTVEVIVLPSDTSSLTVAPLLGQPYAKNMMMSSSKMNSKSGSFISNYMTVHKFLGVSKRAIEDDLSGQFAGSYTADPSTQFYWVVSWVTPDAVNLVTPLEYRLKLTYYTELYSPTGAIFATT